MTQNERVLAKLKAGGVSRNEMFNSYPRITRIAARIHDLELQGYAIEGKKEGNDYIYRLVKPLCTLALF